MSDHDLLSASARRSIQRRFRGNLRLPIVFHALSLLRRCSPCEHLNLVCGVRQLATASRQINCTVTRL